MNTQINFHPADYGIEIKAPEPAAPASPRIDDPSDREGRFRPGYFFGNALLVAHTVRSCPGCFLIVFTLPQHERLVFSMFVYYCSRATYACGLPGRGVHGSNMCSCVDMGSTSLFVLMHRAAFCSPQNGMMGGALATSPRGIVPLTQELALPHAWLDVHSTHQVSGAPGPKPSRLPGFEPASASTGR